MPRRIPRAVRSFIHASRARKEATHDQPVTQRQFARWRNIVAAVVLVVALVGTVSAKLSFDAGQRAGATERADTYRACLSGGELRIETARGLADLRQRVTDALDLLRRLAITGATPAQQETFLKITQPSLDQLDASAKPSIERLLSQAAGRSFKFPEGSTNTVTPEVHRFVADLSQRRCLARLQRLS